MVRVCVCVCKNAGIKRGLIYLAGYFRKLQVSYGLTISILCILLPNSHIAVTVTLTEKNES